MGPRYRSQEILRGPEGTESRVLYKSMGYTDEELTNRPIIGIANSWNTLVPGHFNLRQLAEFVKKGGVSGRRNSGGIRRDRRLRRTRLGAWRNAVYSSL